LSQEQSESRLQRMRASSRVGRGEKANKPGPFRGLLFAYCAVACMVVLASCTTNPRLTDSIQSICANFDWYEIGRADGTYGSSADKLNERQKQCDGTTNPVNPEMYLNGRDEGLITYCTPYGGIQAGRSGQIYEKVCPENTEAAFLRNYSLGEKIHQLEEQNGELEARIANLNALMSPLHSRSSVTGQIEILKGRRFENFTAISTLENQLPNEEASD